MKKINVLTLIDSLALSGAEKVAVDIASSLNKDKFNSYLCATRHGGELEGLLKNNLIPYIILNRKGRLKDVYKLYKAIKFIKEENIHIIHSHKFGSNICGYFLKSLSNAKVHIMHDHTGDWLYEAKMQMLLKRFFFNSSEKTIAISGEIKDKMTNIMNVNPEKLVMLHNGVDINKYDTTINKKKKRESLNFCENSILIGMVAQLRQQKNHEMLLKVVKEVFLMKNNIKFLIIGNGNSERKRTLQNMAKELGIDQNIEFMGRRSDVPELLKILDIAVLTSRCEASPLIILEYLAAKLPVIATSVPGVSEIIENNETGILVGPNDVKGFADAIVKLIEDRTFACSLGKNGFKLARDKFSFKNYMENIESLYQTTLAT